MFIKTDAENQYPRIIDDSGAVPDQADVLSVEITHVTGAGGGAWTGAKSVAIKATLSKQGRALGDFSAARISNTAAMSVLEGGTCNILRRCIGTLSRDVAEWLKNPTPNTVLK
ncbi:MAG: hypothetical protein QX198_01885 [Methylococcaceae bacterium]